MESLAEEGLEALLIRTKLELSQILGLSPQEFVDVRASYGSYKEREEKSWDPESVSNQLIRYSLYGYDSWLKSQNSENQNSLDPLSSNQRYAFLVARAFNQGFQGVLDLWGYAPRPVINLWENTLELTLQKLGAWADWGKSDGASISYQ